MTSDNLPAWPGADLVYHRLMVTSEKLAKGEYKAWGMRKKPRANDKFLASEEVYEFVEAMNEGDEETCKALALRYINYWKPKATCNTARGD